MVLGIVAEQKKVRVVYIEDSLAGGICNAATRVYSICCMDIAEQRTHCHEIENTFLRHTVNQFILIFLGGG